MTVGSWVRKVVACAFCAALSAPALARGVDTCAAAKSSADCGQKKGCAWDGAACKKSPGAKPAKATAGKKKKKKAEPKVEAVTAPPPPPAPAPMPAAQPALQGETMPEGGPAGNAMPEGGEDKAKGDDQF